MQTTLKNIILFFKYIFLLFTKVGNILTGGIIGLAFFIITSLSVQNIDPLVILCSFMISIFFSGFLLWKELNDSILDKDEDNKLPDIEFRMLNTYKSSNNLFGELKTPYPNKIINVEFLDKDNKTLGHVSQFYKVMDADNDLKANYFLDYELRDKLIETIYIQNGLLIANIILINDVHATYTFSAYLGNWKITKEQNHPNLTDPYILKSKHIKD